MNPLTTISPIDGRYHADTRVLAPYFSEAALIRYRVLVEIEYLIAICALDDAPFPPLTDGTIDSLRRVYTDFTTSDAQRIKVLEKTTRHDVKAIEYFLQHELSEIGLSSYIPLIHFALTSADINNLSYTLMWRDALAHVYEPAVEALLAALSSLAQSHAHTPLLSLTHGQSATPTTMGKEFSVFVARLQSQVESLKNVRLQAKLNGATGTWGAHVTTLPHVDWISFSQLFIEKLGLKAGVATTQIEPHDSFGQSLHALQRINSVLIDLCRDMWMYISRGIIAQKKKEEEVGSSTMPHKINPIQFENAEGNLGIANAYIIHLSGKLPVSRLQRDLSDSTVLRNQGMPLAHSLLAIHNILDGLSRIDVNRQLIDTELDSRWEVLAEPLQTMLRKYGHADAYEMLKSLTRGQQVTRESIRQFIVGLDISDEDKQLLLALSPHTYVGLAPKIVERVIKRREKYHSQ
jgi:adenylosuccinate lyase